MTWTQILYGWGGLNEAIFHLINGATPPSLASMVKFLALAGSYWTAPTVMVGLWLLAKRTDDARRANAINNALLLFAVAFAVALATASLLKVTLAFPRPSVVFGDAIRLIGEADSQYSLPSGHATFSALVVSALWALTSKPLQGVLILYLSAVGWSRVAAGMHFPADVAAGWIVGAASFQIAKVVIIHRSLKASGTGLWCGIAVCIAILDQIAKSMVSDHMALWEMRPITSFFNLVHVLNPGAAFSFLASAGGWQRYFFLAIAVLACGWLVVILSRPRSTTETVGFALILGGAFSNALDRALRGPVVDYFDFHWNSWHWPAFNIADVAICIGAGMVAFLTINSGNQFNNQHSGAANANH
ncbi:signal peptidase II [Limnohabitans sp. 15K]|jgi:signal peptidase II|uniref:signal peptidase II n=1 Tax=Limnohabitans sp. 15K TaxID=1100706 RepID=UPI000C1EFFD1|nr:signal peptidase II [Limnohabitans sp. 15K]PIT81073.1 signal peptidase II [Limnohabitans sp. 15K]